METEIKLDLLEIFDNPFSKYVNACNLDFYQILYLIIYK